MDVEGSGQVGRRHEGLDVLLHLTDLIRRARLAGADIAVGVTPDSVGRLSAREVIVLVRGEYEEAVRLVDAVRRQTGEECAEGLVVGVKLGDVVGLAWA